MNTLKTIVVTATLLAVGYGANVVLNKPGNTELRDAADAADAGIWEPFPDNPTGGVPQADTSLLAEMESENRFADPSASVQLSENDLGSAESSNPYASPEQATATGMEGIQPLPPPTSPESQIPVFGDQSQYEKVSHVSPPSLGNGAPAANQVPYGEASSRAQTAIQDQNYSDALYLLSPYYRDPTLTSSERTQLITLLDQLAGTVLYSSQPHAEPAHVVQAGETLAHLSQRYAVSTSFLARVNGLAPGEPLTPGQSIKTVQGPFRGELDLANLQLTLFLGTNYAGRFHVSIGRDFPPNATSMQVAEIAGPRPYSEPTTGQTIAAGDPNNPYGQHWIGLSAGMGGTTNLGIHSSGTSIDASDTRGCISVSDQDAEDLQVILGIGSMIEVIR